MLANDTDTDIDTPHAALSVSALRTGAEAGSGSSGTVGSALAGSYGTLTLQADGSYVYSVDNANAAVNGLQVGDAPLLDRFTYSMADGQGGIDLAELAISVNGANDAPLLNASPGLADQAVNQGASFSYAMPAGLFTDPDGDALTYSATRADGSALPAWLSFNAATQTFSGTPTAADFMAFDVKASATDPGGLSASDVFTVDVNAAPVITSNGGGATAAISVAENATAVTTANRHRCRPAGAGLGLFNRRWRGRGQVRCQCSDRRTGFRGGA